MTGKLQGKTSTPAYHMWTRTETGAETRSNWGWIYGSEVQHLLCITKPWVSSLALQKQKKTNKTPHSLSFRLSEFLTHNPYHEVRLFWFSQTQAGTTDALFLLVTEP